MKSYNLFKFLYSLNLRKRTPVISREIKVCIHEWGGYQNQRSKTVSKIKPFLCGLKFQIERFNSQMTSRSIKILVTVSDYDLFIDTENLKHFVLPVSNAGMDFSGYNAFFQKIKNEENKYIILTNTSVNAFQSNFLDGYIDYLESNTNVGMLGVSYNTQIRQSLIFNNFYPHLQSFFLLTTIDCLKEVVNKVGKFPGCGITNKRLLIRQGEIALSTAFLDLGYDLACVLEDGKIYRFNKETTFDNGRNSWAIPFGDYRFRVSNPNSINPIAID